MDALVVLGFLLIPVAGGIVIAAPTFMAAYFINLFFMHYKFATILVHIGAMIYLTIYFLKAIEGELGRNSAFQIAFIIGASVCLLIYLAVLRATKKWLIKDEVPDNDTEN